MDLVWDLREGIFLRLGMIIRWLLTLAPWLKIIYTFHNYSTREFDVVLGLHHFMYTYNYLKQPKVLHGSKSTLTQTAITPAPISISSAVHE